MASFCLATGRSKEEYLTLTRVERTAFLEAVQRMQR